MIIAAQNISRDTGGRLSIDGDWFPGSLPLNIYLDEMSYPDTAFSFTGFHSEIKNSLYFGYASGNYGRSVFIGGKNSEINIGKFVVLQGTNIICNKSIIIKDHCMLSWGSVVTDSWINASTISIEVRRKLLDMAASDPNRYLEFLEPDPVVVEDNVWIGFKSVILPGVTLGRGCVVGSNSIIAEDVPPYAVVAGNPSRLIRYLEPNDTEEIKHEALKKYVKGTTPL